MRLILIACIVMIGCNTQAQDTSDIVYSANGFIFADAFYAKEKFATITYCHHMGTDELECQEVFSSCDAEVLCAVTMADTDGSVQGVILHHPPQHEPSAN